MSCIRRNDDPNYPDYVWYEIVDEKNGFVISLDLSDKEWVCLTYHEDYGEYPGGEYEEYFYDDENHISFESVN